MTVIGWTGELAGQLGIEFAEDLDQLRADAGRLIAVYGAAAFRSLCLRPENSVSPQRRLRFEKTGSNAMSMRAAHFAHGVESSGKTF